MTRSPRLHPRGALALALLAAAACDDGSVDPAPLAAVDVVFLDQAAALNTVRAGRAPAPTSIRNVLPFAASRGAVAYFEADGLRLFHLDDGQVESLPVPIPSSPGGAISPDGATLAFATHAPGGRVHLNLVQIHTGARETIDVTDTHGAAPQIAFQIPFWSPDGARLGFLLPNEIGMQLFLYEPGTDRIEVHALRVPVATFVQPLAGWPRWTAGQTIRFLARYWKHDGASTPTDTLMVMEIFARNFDRTARAVYFASPPRGIDLVAAGSYSFDRTGDVVAFEMNTGAATGVFLMRKGVRRFEPVAFRSGTTARAPILVP